MARLALVLALASLESAYAAIGIVSMTNPVSVNGVSTPQLHTLGFALDVCFPYYSAGILAGHEKVTCSSSNVVTYTQHAANDPSCGTVTGNIATGASPVAITNSSVLPPGYSSIACSSYDPIGYVQQHKYNASDCSVPCATPVPYIANYCNTYNITQSVQNQDARYTCSGTACNYMSYQWKSTGEIEYYSDNNCATTLYTAPFGWGYCTPVSSMAGVFDVYNSSGATGTCSYASGSYPAYIQQMFYPAATVSSSSSDSWKAALIVGLIGGCFLTMAGVACYFLSRKYYDDHDDDADDKAEGGKDNAEDEEAGNVDHATTVHTSPLSTAAEPEAEPEAEPTPDPEAGGDAPAEEEANKTTEI